MGWVLTSERDVRRIEVLTEFFREDAPRQFPMSLDIFRVSLPTSGALMCLDRQ
jgi:hypothetical protein